MIIENQVFIIKTKKSINKIKHIFGDLDEISLTGEQLIEYFPNSRERLKFECDSCSKIFEVSCCLQNTNKQHLCKSCKTKQTNLEKYGVENPFQSEEIKEKIKEMHINKYGVENVSQVKIVQEKKKQTCLQNYGTEWPSQSKEVQQKIIQSNLNKYGVENVSLSKEIKQKKEETCFKNYGVKNPGQSEEIKNKMLQTLQSNYGDGIINPFQITEIKNKVKQTNLEKYGVENPFQSEEIQNKIKQTWIEKYGVDNPLKSPEIQQKVLNSFYKNGTGPCSKQQKYICNLFDGKLNYPIDNFMLDIAFLDEMIYIEYNGGGHYIYAQHNGKTLDEINQKDVKRAYVLQGKGWKLIKIISMKDKLLSDEQFILLINEAKQYLLTTKHTWVEIDIDNNQYKCSQYTKQIL